jgi:hypothetical protein
MTTEAQEQMNLVSRARYHQILKHHLWAVTNDEYRHPIRGKNQVRKGLKAGVSDLCLSYPVLPYHGLFLELKSATGKLTPEQIDFLQRHADIGYATYVAYSADEAWSVLMSYLDGKFEHKGYQKKKTG